MGHGSESLGGNAIANVGIVLLGDNENMRRGLRVEVAESNNLVILEYNVGGNLMVGNLAEDAIRHRFS
jgi:hypothetical protein